MLTEQTKMATEHIGTIVRDVVKNTEQAVVSMEQNVVYTQSGMESIRKANESAATEENSAGMLSLSRFVGNIRESSEQLNALVQE